MRPTEELPPIEEVPAAHLAGRNLGNGWVVGRRVTRDPGASGGAFSVSYTATHEDGREGFLKALNFAAASVGPGTLADRINHFTAAYIFERDLLRECRNRRMSRVVKMLAHGEVRVNGSGVLRDVPYLILELADGDIRAFLSTQNAFDAAWSLRVIKHVIEGVEQLHLAQTAHQDLKPSNVLTQESGTEMKLGDLGRADRVGQHGPWSSEEIPGAIAYAPPEQHYGHFTGTWEERRAADMYLIGSLAAQLFLGHCMSAMLQERVQSKFRATEWTGTFTAALPALKAAHVMVMESFSQAVEKRIGHAIILQRLPVVVSQMTHPDPGLRGHPKDRRARSSSFSLRRYTGTLNTLTAQAEFHLARRR